MSASVSLIARLRKLTTHSIAQLQLRIAKGQPLIEITPFLNDWQDTRHLLVLLSRGMADGSLPLAVSELSEGEESDVSSEMLRNLIQHYREIELETQMQTQLELGEISDRSEFEPHDEDWTVG